MFFYFELYSKQNEAKIANGFKGSAKRGKSALSRAAAARHAFALGVERLRTKAAPESA
jgi:hypothetical protein